MARRKAQADLREVDRVASEQLTVTVKKGGKAKLKAEAKHRGLSVSAIVQDAVNRYPFVPRDGSASKTARGSGKAGKAKNRSRVKRT